MISVTKRFEFCYGHRLPNYKGKCSNFHGHNSIVEVEVSGIDFDPDSHYQTMVLDFSRLKKIVTAVLDELDHKDLTDFFTDRSNKPTPATAETICLYLVNQVKQQLPAGITLVRLRVSETPDSWAEWKKGA